MLGEACRQARAWIDAGSTVLRSTCPRWSSVIQAATHPCAPSSRKPVLSPSHLELELTETALLRDVDATSDVLHALSAAGIGIAVDEFGTGYSSLDHLRRFPIGTLKIDQSFVQNIVTNAGDAAIVGALVAMGRHPLLRVVAEGVETKEQLIRLKALGCVEGQGYYFSAPLPAESFGALLEPAMLCRTCNRTGPAAPRGIMGCP